MQDTINQWFSPEAQAFLQSPVFLASAGVAFLVFTLAWCRIFARAGHHAGLGLLMLVPGVNGIALLFLAFAPWPTTREVRALRKVQRAARHTDDAHYRQAV